MTTLLITGKTPQEIKEKILNAENSIQCLFAEKPTDEEIRQAANILAVGDICPHQLNRLMGKFVTQISEHEFQKNPEDVIKKALDCQEIFLGVRDFEKLEQDNLTLGKCAVKKNAHRVSLIVMGLLLLGFIIQKMI